MRSRQPTIDRIARSLARLDGSGSFSHYHLESGLGLYLEVDGVGRCALPPSDEDLAALLERASPSPFGYRDETRVDTAVRDSWELPGARVHLDPRRWSQRFDRGVARVAEALGFPPDAVVTPTLQKLLIYGPGQFFAPHRDTEKHPGMAATLVVLLPSRYRGGEVVISHAGATARYDTAEDAASGRVGFLGLYADCVHETRPVARGYRLALTFALTVETSSPLPLRPDDALLDLRQSLASHLARASQLVYLLDHEYAPQSIEWERLKNTDRVRASALRAVADALECDCFLALADVHESFDADVEQDDTDDLDDVVHGLPPGGYGELLGRDVTLERWIDGRGRRCATPDALDLGDDVVTTTRALDRAAYERTYTLWTGNEGGGADQWYRQAALVVVRRGSPLHAELTPIATEPPPPRAPAVRRRRRDKPG